MNEAANKRRDQRLRRRILDALSLALKAPLRGLNGQTLFDWVDAGPPGATFEDVEHAFGLCGDLVNAGLIEEKPIERRRSQRDGMEFRFYRITDAGTRLLNEASPAHPLVDDERVIAEDAR